MAYCIICKEIVDERYVIEACDSRIMNNIKGHVCRHCFHKLIDSKHNVGFFKLSSLTSWARHRRDGMRIM